MPPKAKPVHRAVPARAAMKPSAAIHKLAAKQQQQQSAAARVSKSATPTKRYCKNVAKSIERHFESLCTDKAALKRCLLATKVEVDVRTLLNEHAAECSADTGEVVKPLRLSHDVVPTVSAALDCYGIELMEWARRLVELTPGRTVFPVHIRLAGAILAHQKPISIDDPDLAKKEAAKQATSEAKRVARNSRKKKTPVKNAAGPATHDALAAPVAAAVAAAAPVPAPAPARQKKAKTAAAAAPATKKKATAKAKAVTATATPPVTHRHLYVGVDGEI